MIPATAVMVFAPRDGDELVKAGVITRTHHPEISPRVVYELTEAGLALEPVIAEMSMAGA